MKISKTFSRMTRCCSARVTSNLPLLSYLCIILIFGTMRVQSRTCSITVCILSDMNDISLPPIISSINGPTVISGTTIKWTRAREFYARFNFMQRVHRVKHQCRALCYRVKNHMFSPTQLYSRSDK